MYKNLLSVFLTAFILTGCGSIQEDLPTATDTNQPTNNIIDTEQPTETAENSQVVLPTDTQQAPQIPSLTPELSKPVRGIILFIGDGMGPNQRLGAQWLTVGQEGKLWMDQLPVQGWQKTGAANAVVTDSAAAATAIATGVKTNYRFVGVDPDGNPLPTILEQAKQLGWSVGLVTTVQMAHATPAGFAAHVPDRDDMTTIALQIFENDVDVLLGGGEGDFIPRGEAGCHSKSGNRNDDRNLIEEAVADGYVYVCTPADFLSLDFAQTSRLMGFFGDEEMIAPYTPTLTELTHAAITILSQNPNGFFLMVEAGQIDWAGHDSEGEDILHFTQGLDQAVLEGLAYFGEHQNTLIIVTADHETGGMELQLGDSGPIYRVDGPFGMPDGTQFWVNWSGRGNHTPIDVQVSAQGPYAEYLSGTYENTFIYNVMYAAMMGIEVVK